MAIKLFENFVAKANRESLAQKLVNFDADAASNLARAIEVHLQDKSWSEIAEGIDPMS